MAGTYISPNDNSESLTIELGQISYRYRLGNSTREERCNASQASAWISRDGGQLKGEQEYTRPVLTLSDCGKTLGTLTIKFVLASCDTANQAAKDLGLNGEKNKCASGTSKHSLVGAADLACGSPQEAIDFLTRNASIHENNPKKRDFIEQSLSIGNNTLKVSLAGEDKQPSLWEIPIQDLSLTNTDSIKVMPCILGGCPQGFFEIDLYVRKGSRAIFSDDYFARDQRLKMVFRDRPTALRALGLLTALQEGICGTGKATAGNTPPPTASPPPSPALEYDGPRLIEFPSATERQEGERLESNLQTLNQAFQGVTGESEGADLSPLERQVRPQQPDFARLFDQVPPQLDSTPSPPTATLLDLDPDWAGPENSRDPSLGEWLRARKKAVGEGADYLSLQLDQMLGRCGRRGGGDALAAAEKTFDGVVCGSLLNALPLGSGYALFGSRNLKAMDGLFDALQQESWE